MITGGWDLVVGASDNCRIGTSRVFVLTDSAQLYSYTYDGDQGRKSS